MFRALESVLIFGLVACCVCAQSQPNDATENVGNGLPEKITLEFLWDHPIIHSANGHVERLADGTWQIVLEDMESPLEFVPVRGKSDFPERAMVEGRVDIGVHGNLMVLGVNTEAGVSHQAAIELTEDEAVKISDGNRRRLLNPPTTRESLKKLEEIRKRLLIMSQQATLLPQFGMLGEITAAQSSLQACPGGSCICFLVCRACCPAGTLPSCTCIFLEQYSCQCTTVETTNRAPDE